MERLVVAFKWSARRDRQCHGRSALLSSDEQVAGDLMKPFRDMYAKDLNTEHLQREIHAQGYVLIRQLLPVEDIDNLLHAIVQILAASGWLSPGTRSTDRVANPDAACGESDPVFKPVYEQIFNLEAFHGLAHHARLRAAMRMLVGPRLLVHPKPVGRVIFPNCDRFVIDAHQDYRAIGGDADCYTAWMPLHDCPAELGPLQILEASHRFGLQDADPATGTIARDNTRGEEWVSGRINTGDVLIFHGLTIHSASPNISGQLRVSLDCRFQDYALPLNPASLVFPGSNDRSWEATYANWRSDDLKYFWEKLPLTLKPSRQELAELIKTDESPRMRTRYSRILNQLELQMQQESHRHNSHFDQPASVVNGPAST
jgi:ectoine hydroxylase-related dioxygenase (phytanoyl-CoA dioxygenase family)